MAVATEPRELPITSVDDAVEAVWEHVIEDKSSLMGAVLEVWPRCRFSQATLHLLAQEGLRTRAHDTRSHRARDTNSSPGVAWGAPHGKNWKPYLNSLTHVYMGASEEKPLYYFDENDLAVYALKMDVFIDTYRRRREWASFTQERLKEHNKKKVCDLPAEALKEVAEAANEAFQRLR